MSVVDFNWETIKESTIKTPFQIIKKTIEDLSDAIKNAQKESPSGSPSLIDVVQEVITDLRILEKKFNEEQKVVRNQKTRVPRARSTSSRSVAKNFVHSNPENRVAPFDDSESREERPNTGDRRKLMGRSNSSKGLKKISTTGPGLTPTPSREHPKSPSDDSYNSKNRDNLDCSKGKFNPVMTFCSFNEGDCNTPLTKGEYKTFLTELKNEPRIDFPELIIEEANGFYVENTYKVFQPEDYQYRTVPHMYSISYYHNPHKNYFAKRDDEVLILSVIIDKERGMMKWLQTQAEGFCEFKGSIASKKGVKAILESLYKDYSISRIRNEDIRNDILELEKTHRQKASIIRIGVIQTLMLQSDPLEMLNNSSTPELKEFLDLMGVVLMEGEKVDKVQTTHRDMSCDWHVAPYQHEDQHRRFIGNDPCIIFFLEPGIESFSLELVNNLGSIPQLFILVQPYKNRYRIKFFNKNDLQPFGPFILSDYLYSRREIKELIMMKIHNGMMNTKNSSVISKFFTNPRAAELTDITKKYSGKRRRKSRAGKGGTPKLSVSIDCPVGSTDI